MYSMIDVISPAIEQAKKDVYADRNKYKEFMLIIEKFAVVNGLIASGGYEHAKKDHKWVGKTSKNVANFMREYAAGPGRVVVGEAAAQLWASNFKTDPFETTKHLTVVANANLDDEGLLVAEIASKYGLTVEWATKDPYVPVDIRLRRLTVYTMAGRIRVDTLLDVYNSATYDLIPYKPYGDYKIGSLFTVMRFLLVEKWLIGFLHMIGAIRTTTFTEKIDRMFIAVSDRADELILSGEVESFEQLLPLNFYIGRLESMAITLRRIQNQEKKFYSPYYPVATRQPQ